MVNKIQKFKLIMINHSATIHLHGLLLLILDLTKAWRSTVAQNF